MYFSSRPLGGSKRHIRELQQPPAQLKLDLITPEHDEESQLGSPVSSPVPSRRGDAAAKFKHSSFYREPRRSVTGFATTIRRVSRS